MITWKVGYYGLNIILGGTCVVLIALAFKLIPDKSVKRLFITALVLLILAGGILSVCQGFYKMFQIAYVAELAGKVEPGTSATLNKFRDLALLGPFLECIAAAIFVSVGSRMIKMRVAGAEEGGGAE